MKEYIEISSELYGGNGIFSKAKSAYSADIISCNNTENCEPFKESKCIMSSRLSGSSCPYGKKVTINGTSPRSKSYTKLAYETRNRNSYCKMKEPGVRFCSIGEYYFIATTYLNFWLDKDTGKYIDFEYHKNNYHEDNLVSKGSYIFIKKEDLTESLVNYILSAKPRTWFGFDEIVNYQLKIVPIIKAEILKYAPDIAKRHGIDNLNYVGMLGQLNTLKPPFTFIHQSIEFRYNEDGYVTSNDDNIIDSFIKKEGWFKFVGDIVEVFAKFKPNNNVFITIDNNDWVLPTSTIKGK